MAQFRIRLNIDGLKRLQTATGGRGGSTAAPAISSGAGSPMRKVYTKWAARYSGFVRRRYNVYSRGGGNWKPLALSTILARRSSNRKFATRGAELESIQGRLAKASARGGKGSKSLGKLVSRSKYLASGQGVTILKDRGILFGAITIGQQGNLVQDLPNGVRYGFAPTPYPVQAPLKASGKTIAQIAGYHNAGSLNGRPPRRLILAQPDQQTVNGMVRDLNQGIREIARGR